MRNSAWTYPLIAAGVILSGMFTLRAQDWPQWRGPNRDAKATGFEAPKTWPKELKKDWSAKIGDGVATPALVGDRLYVFTRQGDDEVIRCLDAASGKEIWKDQYAAKPATGGAARFPGPRCSPTVAQGKVVTLGVRGTLSCLDAGTGKVLWRKNDFKDAWPVFFTSSSPLIVDGLCVAQLGGKEKGGFTGQDNAAVVAYDLASGDEKWKWAGDSTAYASPVVLSLDGAKAVVAETDKRVVALDLADGKLLWETPFVSPNTRGNYNAATPIVEGQTLIYTGSSRGATAVKLRKEGSGVSGSELWKNEEESVVFNTPVVKDGLLYGISQRNQLFCLNLQDGKTDWTAQIGPVPPPPPAGGPRGGRPGGGPPGGDFRGGRPPGVPGGGMRGGPPGRGGRMGRPGSGYGTIVDAGSVLLSLTPNGQLLVFAPSDKEFKQIAKYKVANGDTYAYPIPSGKAIFIKDGDSVSRWSVQ
jgi:outer membrane protein assembly factor BamB